MATDITTQKAEIVAKFSNGDYRKLSVDYPNYNENDDGSFVSLVTEFEDSCKYNVDGVTALLSDDGEFSNCVGFAQVKIVTTKEHIFDTWKDNLYMQKLQEEAQESEDA